ncbi:hypothetical protein BTJ40_06300 [Microbulbifer sp. A4B17]|uniref:hypothetical protein n=1 Tax=Microbulbifer sp. A4B17 TaxID=359370 RepID=UPI000D52ABB5|nr:hypothetical protein [Microbulbifer sp. A4B17]AWF80454.1 hypothetical protein BTJ40_06300 [Microbulbifer sp. A4B17]
MRFLVGSYGKWESLISAIVFCLFLFLNFVFFAAIFEGTSIDDKSEFMILFVNCVLFVIISLPLITRLLTKIPDSKFKEFLELPDTDEKFTYSNLSSFLGDQALSSFLATVLIVTGRDAIATYGGGLAALYVSFLFVVALILAALSLVRFISHFTRYHWFYYALAATLSTSIMFAFFNVGLRLGA